MSDHDALMAQTMRNAPGFSRNPSIYDTYNAYLSPEKQAALTELERIILCDYADVAYQARNVSWRRRTEWPVLDLPLMKNLANLPFSANVDLKEEKKIITGAGSKSVQMGRYY